MRTHRMVAACAALMFMTALGAGAALGEGADGTARLRAVLAEAASALAMSDEDPAKWRTVSRAVAELSEVREAYPGTDAALTAGMVEGAIRASRPGNWEEGISPLTFVIATAPDSWQAAFCHHELAYAHSSRACFLVEKSTPDYAGAWEQFQAARADAEAALGRLPRVPEAAVAEVRKYYPLSEVGTWLASSHFIFGYVDWRLGRVGEAIEHWNTVLGRFSGLPGWEETRIPLNAREYLRELGLVAGQAAPGERQAAMVSARERLEAAGLELSWDSPHRTASFSAAGFSVAFTPDENIITVNGVAAHASPTLVSSGDDVRVPEKLLNACLAAIELQPLALPSTAKSLSQARQLAKARNAALAKLFAATRLRG